MDVQETEADSVVSKIRLGGLIAAPFTPFDSRGHLNVEVIPGYAGFLADNGVSGVFVCGTTGEGMSMTVDERLAVASAWVDAAPKDLKIVIHVGHTALEDAKRLAAHAQSIGAWGIGQMAPSFFKPKSMNELVDFCAETAAAAPALPYYYYHIPVMTGVNVKMVDFLLSARDRIPNLAGVKYTYEDLMDMQLCREIDNGRFDMLFGRDELLICGLALGCTGAVGSTYNDLAPLYLDIWDAFARHDMRQANELQLISMRTIEAFFKYGNPMVCGKAMMRMLGIDCGPVRLPLRSLSADAERELEKDLRDIAYFEHCSRQGGKKGEIA